MLAGFFESLFVAAETRSTFDCLYAHPAAPPPSRPFRSTNNAVTCIIMQKNGAGLHTASSCFWDNSGADGSFAFAFRLGVVCVCVCVCVFVCVCCRCLSLVTLIMVCVCRSLHDFSSKRCSVPWFPSCLLLSLPSFLLVFIRYSSCTCALTNDREHNPPMGEHDYVLHHHRLRPLDLNVGRELYH